MSGDRDRRLSDLWGRRPELSRDEWTELCELVLALLRPYARKSRLMGALKNFGEAPEEIVQEFILHKVLQGGFGTRCNGAGALRLFFDNYLRDKLRSYQNWPVESLEGIAERQEDGSLPPEPPDRRSPSLEEILQEVGLTIDGVRRSAREWLRRQEAWAILYLKFNFCPDAWKRIPLSQLAKASQIPSYHYRARRLGIVWCGRNPPEAYERTMMGQWLVSLGLSFKEEGHQRAIGAVLQILCDEVETLG